MPLKDALLGKPIPSSRERGEKLSVWTGIPALGLDALASTGYGPEAALAAIGALGAAGLRYFLPIELLVVLILGNLYVSYLQTAEAYPHGGGAYNVSKDNFGPGVALWAGVALLLDYLLNVAVGISAGVGAVVSVVPALHPHTLSLCLLVLLTLLAVNLRGVRETGLVFILPVVVFIGSLAGVMLVGLWRDWRTGGHPHALVAPPALPHAVARAGAWLLLAAFANGCTAMTGIEAVSDGVPLFRPPTVRNAQRTLTAIIAALALFLLAMGRLCAVYGIGAMNERRPGYQNVLAQLVAAVAGHNLFFYIALASIFVVLTYSAQTSFTDFPRICHFLAEDRYMPRGFANRGRRLVYTAGILLLAGAAAVLLIVSRGITDNLIPLFAVGAFGAFLASQAGMVRHWKRHPGRGVGLKRFCNFLGAVTAGVVLVMIVAAKFTQGAWMALVAVPCLVWLLLRMHVRYAAIGREVGTPVSLKTAALQPPLVVVPIAQWDRVAEKAVRLGLLLSREVTAVHVTIEDENAAELRKIWRLRVKAPAVEAGIPPPELRVLKSPYRAVVGPVIHFCHQLSQHNAGRVVMVIVPELIEPRWYNALLHGWYAFELRLQLRRLHNHNIVVLDAPWRLRDDAHTAMKP